MRRRWFSVPCTLVLACVMAAPAFAAPPSATPGQTTRTTQAVIATYFRIVNAGLQGASFAALPSVYAPTALLTVSTPKGVTTAYQGLSAITGWYKGFAATHHGLRLTRETVRTPLPDVLIDYERAGTAGHPVMGLCAHVFVLRQGKIVSDDFIVFYGG